MSDVFIGGGPGNMKNLANLRRGYALTKKFRNLGFSGRQNLFLINPHGHFRIAVLIVKIPVKIIQQRKN